MYLLTEKNDIESGAFATIDNEAQPSSSSLLTGTTPCLIIFNWKPLDKNCLSQRLKTTMLTDSVMLWATLIVLSNLVR